MRAKATLKQISKELGFSISTISKALSDSPEISENTKRRIKEFAQLKNYKPNSMAKNLKNQETKTLGVIIPNILNPFFAKVFVGIEKIANERGYNLITYIANESFEKEKHALDLLSNGSVDGFILSVAEETQKLNEFLHFKETIANGYPIVMFDRITNDVQCDKVVVNDYDSAFDATDYLIEKGCKNIALFSCIDDLSVGKLRQKGYEDALKKHQLNINKNIILSVNNEEYFNDNIESVFKNYEIDGVFGLDEHASTYSMKIALKLNKKIPQEIKFIGFADGTWSRRLTPSLSTVSQHAPAIGEKAATLLIDTLTQKDEFYKYQTYVLKTELRERESTK
ncbi:MAG: LacI family DNA-binding transcriptional regulator [Flavobacterium sp.]